MQFLPLSFVGKVCFKIFVYSCIFYSLFLGGGGGKEVNVTSAKIILLKIINEMIAKDILYIAL